jgi:hypothetical protein
MFIILDRGANHTAARRWLQLSRVAVSDDVAKGVFSESDSDTWHPQLESHFTMNAALLSNVLPGVVT